MSQKATEWIQDNKPYMKLIALNSVVGIMFMLVNFPEFLRRMTLQHLGDGGLGRVVLLPVAATQRLMMEVIEIFSSGPPDALRVLISCSFVGLLLYFVALAIFSIRHRDLVFLALGIGGLLFGALALHLIAWLALGIVLLLQLLSTIWTYIVRILGIIVLFLIQHG